MTFSRCFQHFIRIVHVFLRTFSGLSQNFLRTFSRLSQDFPRTFSGLSQEFLKTFPGRSQDCLKNFVKLSQDILRTLEFGPDCFGLVFPDITKMLSCCHYTLAQLMLSQKPSVKYVSSDHPCTAHYTLHTANCTLHFLHWKLYTAHYTSHCTVHCTTHFTHCNCTLHTTLYAPQDTLKTTHCICRLHPSY